MAGFDKIDPADPCLLCGALRACAGPGMTAKRVCQPYREMPARALDEGIPVVGEYALQRQIGVLGKVRRVLMS